MHPTRFKASLGAMISCGLATLAVVAFPVAALALGGSVGGHSSPANARPATSLVSAVTPPNPTWSPTQP